MTPTSLPRDHAAHFVDGLDAGIFTTHSSEHRRCRIDRGPSLPAAKNTLALDYCLDPLRTHTPREHTSV